MFLMNPPPVVALQTTWGSFGAKSYKFPVQFSESEEDIAGTPINAKVQMIITNLQTDESSLDMNNEYECIMQKNRNGDKCVDGFAVSARVVKVQSQECVKVGLPSQIGSTEEENIEFGPLVLDSDSDDSVDRDIEEAIQEYLKNKGEGAPSHSSDAECSRTIDCDKYFKSRVSPLGKPRDRMAGRDPESYNEASLEICEKLHHVSPDSDDSDDSFEDSIRAEIEQFLIEKKRRENSKIGSTSGNKIESLPKVKPEQYLRGPEKPNCTILKQSSEQFVFGKPKAIKSRPQSRCLNSTSIASSKSLKENTTAVKTSNIRCSMLEQRRVVDAALEPTLKHPMDESSGSSSDDGIEEAIKLFQMEKQKKEGKFTVQHSSSLKNQFLITNRGDSITPISLKGLAVEAPKKTGTKRKRTNTKSTEQKLSRASSPNPKALKHNIPPSPPEDTIVQSEICLMGSRRAESAAELLCAEAILDISKTIFPTPVENNPNSYESTVNSPSILNQSENDSSEVDSDDSIEQEIRSFLAQKAQSECSFKSEDPRPLTRPPSKPIISCKTSPPGKKLSLSHKRKLKKEKRETAPSEKENIDTTVESSQVTEQGELNCLIQSENDLNNRAKALQDSLFGKCAQQAVPAGFTAASCHVVASDDMSPPRASFDGGGQERGRFRTRQRNCSGDKSSSLDSDEDLDAAIKDLLRSKRKCKKRTKDQKLHCKKKVRFGETEMQDLETFDALKQKEFSLKCPSALKSCLLKPKEMQQNEVKKENATKTDISSAPDILQKVNAPNPVCTASTSESLMQECIVESDDNSSVDSDDSIELEIRKFLAEKAKESVSHIQPGDTLAVSNSSEKRKEEVLSQHQMSTEKPKEQSQDSSVVSHQLNSSEGKPSESCTSETYSHDVEIQTPQKNTPIPNKVNSPCGKAGVILHKDTNAHQEKLANANFRQIVLSADISKSTFPVTFLGNFVAGVQYIPGKVRTVVVNRQHLYSVVPSTRESPAQALLKKVAFGVDGQTAKTTQSSEVHKGKDPMKELITIPVISTEPKKLGILSSENVKEQTLGALSLDLSSSRKIHEVDPVVSKESPSRMKESTQPLHLNVLKEQQSIKAVVSQGQKSAFCTENVNITNKTSEITGSSSQKVINESYPVILKPQSQLECTYLKYTHRVDQREEAVDTGSCRFNICVENKDSGEKGKGSNFSSFSSAIDPGFAMQPYIILSPEKLCKPFYFHDCRSTAAIQGKVGKKKWNIMLKL